jgi:HlyD family secretion protein
MKTLIYFLIFAVLAGSGAFYIYHTYGGAPEIAYTTAKVDRGNLDLIIRATGTLEPEEVVDVGAQVAGLIKDFGKDLDKPDKSIDYNSHVEAGTLLAHIDDALFQTQVAAARANLEHAQADVVTAQAKIEQADNELDRAKVELPRKAISKSDYDIAVANKKVADASLLLAQAGVDQSKAALQQTEINLRYTEIKSPVKGTIIDRRVNVGQTVVASLNAPSLFLIAKDLKKMQIWASVNEADMGQIHVDQDVQFTVDAFPDRIFKGKVIQPRNNAQMTQNVVTYTVVISVDNSDGKLLPYQTANVQFDAGKHDNVLLVPNIALRWRPQPQQVRPEDRDEYVKRQKARSQRSQASTTGGSGTAKAPDLKAEKDRRERGILWLAEGQFVRAVPVKIGASDGSTTEITSGDVKEGDEVVTGEEHIDAASSTENPFAPKLFGGRKG